MAYNGDAMEEKPVVKKGRVIDSFWTFLVATAVLGPFALPLLWRNPRYKVTTKVAASVAVILFTYFLVKFANTFLETMLGSALNGL